MICDAQVRSMPRAEEIALEKEIRKLKRAQYSADAKLDVIVGHLPSRGTPSAEALRAHVSEASGGIAPSACEVKQFLAEEDATASPSGQSWGFAIVSFDESPLAWDACAKMAGAKMAHVDPEGGAAELELSVAKLYLKDKPKPPPPPAPAPPPAPVVPEGPTAEEKLAKKNALMRKLKAVGKVAGTMSRVKSLTKHKINDPKMSLNNRLTRLEEELAKYMNSSSADVVRSERVRLKPFESCRHPEGPAIHMGSATAHLVARRVARVRRSVSCGEDVREREEGEDERHRTTTRRGYIYIYIWARVHLAHRLTATRPPPPHPLSCLVFLRARLPPHATARDAPQGG